MISIVIPVYNEQAILPHLYQRISSAARSWGCDYEVIVVDDGSTDGTTAQLAAIHYQDPRWKLITLSRNFGHQSAVSTGIRFSRGDCVAVMDGDLQDPPEVLIQLIARWREGYQVVYAIRTKRKENFFKRLAYKAFYRLLQRLAAVDIPLDSGDFCVMDRSVVNVLNSLPERTRFVRGLRSWVGFRQIGVPFERQARYAGRAKYDMRKLMRLAFDGIVSFSHAPLRLASWLGMALCGLSVVGVLLVLAWWMSGTHIFGMHPRNSVGWTSLMSLLLLLSGIQMLLIGVLGEYLARVFDEVKGRPLGVISSAVGFDETDVAAARGPLVDPAASLRPGLQALQPASGRHAP